MALITCPECGKQVSSFAHSCPECGYPIAEMNMPPQPLSEKDIDIQRLTEQIIPFEYQIPSPRAKVCIRCGKLFWYHKERPDLYNIPACECEYPGIEVDYPMAQAGEHGAGAYIFRSCLITHNIGDKDCDAYWENKKYNVTGQASLPPDPKYFGKNLPPKPKAAESSRSAYTSAPKQTPNVPRCPICNSTKLTKITTMKKAGKVAIWGVLAAGDVSKTWKCENCGSKF